MTAMLHGHERDAGQAYVYGGNRATDDLRHEHALILRAVAVAEALATSAGRTGSLDRPRLARLVAFLTRFADGCHHTKEEQHLFPALARAGVPDDRGPVAALRADHAAARALVAAMAGADDAGVVRALRDYARLLRAHVDTENAVLLPLADETLSDAARRELARAFERVEQAVAGDGEHHRLIEELSRLETEVG